MLNCRCFIASYTGYTQKNGAVSKVNKKFISHPTRAKLTLSAAATVEVSHVLPAFARAYCGAAGPVSKMASQQKAFSCCDAILEIGPAAPQ